MNLTWDLESSLDRRKMYISFDKNENCLVKYCFLTHVFSCVFNRVYHSVLRIVLEMVLSNRKIMQYAVIVQVTKCMEVNKLTDFEHSMIIFFHLMLLKLSYGLSIMLDS